jgi:hypothetical protein
VAFGPLIIQQAYCLTWYQGQNWSSSFSADVCLSVVALCSAVALPPGPALVHLRRPSVFLSSSIDWPCCSFSLRSIGSIPTPRSDRFPRPIPTQDLFNRSIGRLHFPIGPAASLCRPCSPLLARSPPDLRPLLALGRSSAPGPDARLAPAPILARRLGYSAGPPLCSA